MKKGRDGVESCSRSRGKQAWIHTRLRSLCRACGFRIRFESHFQPPSLQLDQVLSLRHRLPSASVPSSPTLRIRPGQVISVFSPVRMCSVTKGTDGSLPKGIEFLSILHESRDFFLCDRQAVSRWKSEIWSEAVFENLDQ